MMRFLLVVKGGVVDSADSPESLHFTMASGQTYYEVRLDIDGNVRPLAAMDLTGYKHCHDFVAAELCKDINLRRAFSSFEEELKIVDGPIITFGVPNVGSDGFIV
jgi:hypothetical protein